MKSTDETRRGKFRRMICSVCAACIVIMNMNAGWASEAEVTDSPADAQILYETVTVQEGTLTIDQIANVRSGAGTTHKVLTQMKPGDVCEVLGEENGWYHIIFGEVEGYITAEYITVRSVETQIPIVQETPAPTAMEGHELVVKLIGTMIADKNVNVRSGAGTEYAIMLQIAPFDTCEVLSNEENLPIEENGWYKVQIGEIIGYAIKDCFEVRVEYIQVPIATPTPEPMSEPTSESTSEPTTEPVSTPTVQPDETVPDGYELREVQIGTIISQLNVNMRKGAGTGYGTIRQLTPGTTFIVTGEIDGWYGIELDGELGYVTAEYVEVKSEVRVMPIPTATPVPTATPEPTATAAPGYELREMNVGTVISESAVSIRAKADVNSEVISYIAPGKNCFVLDDRNEWYEVQFGEYTGYVAKEYLSVMTMITQVPVNTPVPQTTPQPTDAPTNVPDIGYETVEKQVATVVANMRTNVREGAGTNYKILLSLAPGETCFVLGEEDEWYQVDANGTVGYIAKEFVSVSTQLVQVPIATPAPTETPAPTQRAPQSAPPGFEWVQRMEGTPNTQIEVNLRQGPGTNYGIVGRMKPGDTCKVLEQEGDWYRVEFNGLKGYALSEYVAVRTYEELVEIIIEDPLKAQIVNLQMPYTMMRGETSLLQGIIESNIPITGVTVSVEDLRNVTTEMTAELSIARDENMLSFDLMQLDEQIKFRKLAAGEKKLTITVNSTNDSQVVLEKSFYVIGNTKAMASITDECKFAADSGNTDRVKDQRYNTAWQGDAAGHTLRVTVPERYVSETMVVEWSSAPETFELILDGTQVTVDNKDEKLHFTFATGGACEIGIRVSNPKDAVCELRVYEQGRTPEILQDWQAAGDKVDMMVIVAHQGDEFSLFGGAIPQAVAEGKEVLVVYMTDCGRDRYAEAMNGLWSVGVRTHPVFLGLENGNPRAYEDAIEMWGLEETYETLTSLLRRYKPDVVLTHDINGEENDNQQKLTSATVRRAVLLATDEAVYPEDAQQYGAWDVDKTYIHLYEANVITVDIEQMPEGLNGWTIRDALRAALHKNGLLDNADLNKVYIREDESQYSMHSFGLIRTNVGYDEIGNSFFENIEAVSAEESGASDVQSETADAE